jgi:hypothetical protein
MKDYWNTIKRLNVQTMGIDEEEVQAKGIENGFNKK